MVHAFEPDPSNRAILRSAFGDCGNVRIVPAAVSDEAGELQLFTSDVSTGISSLAPFTSSHKASSIVPVLTLKNYLADAGITRVDFMKIDVEGFERNVLRGYDWSFKPEMIVLEFEDAKTLSLGYSWKDLAEDLVERGYEVLVSEWYPIERYGAYGDTHRWRALKRYPTELVDGDAWGNLIAGRSVERFVEAAHHAVRRVRLRRRLEYIRRLRSRRG